MEKHELFQQEYTSLTLVSNGTLSEVYDKCIQCDKLFENEFDLKQHKEKVHEYGEIFDLYWCEDFGFRGTYVLSIRAHIKEQHNNLSKVCVSLEDFGIVQLPEVSKRRKQNFEDFVIDENGDIEVEEGVDENFKLSNDDIVVSPVPGRKSIKRKITTVVSPPKKRRIESNISYSTEKNSDFICQIHRLEPRQTLRTLI